MIPRLAKDWVPPTEYLEALASRVLPIYLKIRHDLGRGAELWRTLSDIPYPGRSADTADLETPIVLGWDVDVQLSPAFFLLYQGRFDPTRDSTNRDQASEDAFWDALVSVLEDTDVHGRPGAPSLPLLLDGTVRTLEWWATRGERIGNRRVWHPPIHPWPGVNETRWMAALPESPMSERVAAIVDRNREAQTFRSAIDDAIPGDDSVLMSKILHGIGELEPSLRETVAFLLREVITPRLTRALMTVREYQIHDQLQRIEEQFQALEEKGGELLRQHLTPAVRWRLEGAMTSYRDMLRRSLERWQDARKVMDDEGLQIPDDFGPVRFQPSGRRGRPRNLFSDLVSVVYELVYRHRAETGQTLPPLGVGKPHRAVLEETARILSWAFTPEELDTHADGKLYQQVNRRCHAGGARPF